jgi:methylmalonyl-CoA mutase
MSVSSNLTFDEFPANTYAEWRAAAEESLKGAPFEKKLITRLHEGIALQPIYNASDLEGLGWPERWPGLVSYERGAQPAPDRVEPWWIAQELPYGDPAVFNRALLEDLNRGQNAVNLLLDVATRRGLDPDAAEAHEVAQCGLSLSLLADWEKALHGVSLEAIPLLCWAGASALPSLGALVALAEARHTELSTLRGGILADPLTEWARDGRLPMALSDAYGEMAASISWLTQKNCPLRCVGVQGGLWADAGATAVEELAYALATATEYFRELLRQGLSPNVIAPRFFFEFTVTAEVFPQVAKLRAARWLWSRVIEVCGAQPTPMFLHARSSILNKSTLDPHTNMLRATAEGFVGAVGGANSMHVAAFDEAVRSPDTFSRRIARNAQIILAEECGFEQPLDPAGGSWFIECLTAELAHKAWELFQKIESQGGMANALREGTVQVQTAQSAAQRRAAVAQRKDGLIGVNLFPNPTETPLPTAPLDMATSHQERCTTVQNGRTAAPLALVGLETVKQAWQQGNSLGQIAGALERPGEAEIDIQRIRVTRLAEEYEELRLQARTYAANHGGCPPKIWLACFGPAKQHKARAEFAAGFLTPGGFLVENGMGAKTIAEAVDAAVAAQPLAVVICSTDDTYPEIVPDFIPALRERLPNIHILLAGYPAEQIAAHEAAGVNDFLHLKRNCLEFNQSLQKTLGLA